MLGAIAHARAVGAATIGLSCNAGSLLSSAAEYRYRAVVGGEVIAGSSRLNAGTAQKIALNTLSTSVMVRMGKTYGNLMVDVRATNTKLRDRALRIVESVTGAGRQTACDALEAAGWNTKLACLMASSGKDLGTATCPGGVGRTPPTGPGPGRHRCSAPRCSAGRSGPKWKRLGVGAAFVDGVLVGGDVAIDDGAVVAVGLPGDGPAIAVPGLVDLQVNGYAGVDVAAGSVDELGGDGPRPGPRRRARLPAHADQRRPRVDGGPRWRVSPRWRGVAPA